MTARLDTSRATKEEKAADRAKGKKSKSMVTFDVPNFAKKRLILTDFDADEDAEELASIIGGLCVVTRAPR